MGAVTRGVGEGGAGGGSCPPTFESWGTQPLQFFTSTHAPFLTGPPSFQLAPTPLVTVGKWNIKWLGLTCIRRMNNNLSIKLGLDKTIPAGVAAHQCSVAY